MSKTITVNDFSGGIAEDNYNGKFGEFSSSRQFDISAYTNRLYPLRAQTDIAESTGIGNLLVGTDGAIYGLGTDVDNGFGSGTDKEQTYKRTDWGSTGTFTGATTSEAEVPSMNLWCEYPAMSRIFFATPNKIKRINYALSSTTSQALTYVTIGQGFVHPSTNNFYFPYTTSSATIIARYNSAGTFNATAFTPIPANYTVVSLSNYNDYLAIGCNSPEGKSYLILWDMDETNNAVNVLIPWGSGRLQLLNNLNGVLIGISIVGSLSSSYSAQDYDSIVIKGYQGGVPVVLKTIPTDKVGTAFPTITINTRVNFVHRDKLYFSADIVAGTTQKGLWAFTKNKKGQWVAYIERYANGANDGSDASVLAACMGGDLLMMVYTANGTINYTRIGTTTLAGLYINKSLYESVVNPNMPDLDKLSKKQVVSVSAHYLPLPSGASVIMKYRVDSNGSWTTIFTESTAGNTFTEFNNAGGTNFTSGRQYEFRLESTGSAQILGFTYKYNILETNV